ncbi:MAG: hypothetical protein LBR39_07475, partial [Coriobacteriales bacterium]|nr:hypothetical protein [Coriobacteriales bacterium]
MTEEVLRMILIAVAVILLIVLIIVGIEAIRTLRRVRKTVEDLDPTISRVNNTLDTLEPALKRLDPLMERVSLTVDAVNLEIMRADQILADISDVTNVTSGTVKKVSGIADAPLNLLAGATDRVRSIFVDRKTVKSSREILSGIDDGETEVVVAPDPDTVPEAVPASDFVPLSDSQRIVSLDDLAAPAVEVPVPAASVPVPEVS